jgi:uncharacterized protein (TIGR03437 family)
MLSWSAAADQPWVAVNPSSGIAPSTVAVSINSSGLKPGVHRSTITISGDGATNTPRTVRVTLTLNSPPEPSPPPQLITKNAASFASGPLAPEMISYGEAPGIAASLIVASTNPWPTTLGGVSLEITDSLGITHPASVYFVGQGSMGYLVPGDAALGAASTKLTTSTGTVITGTLTIARTSPGLFTANANGSGVAAGLWIRFPANGSETYGYLFDAAQPEGSRGTVPVVLDSPDDQVFLSLYGTGFRGAATATATIGGLAVPVYGFAADAVYQGEDVLNLGPLPPSLAGQGEVPIMVSFDDQPANVVTVSFR